MSMIPFSRRNVLYLELHTEYVCQMENTTPPSTAGIAPMRKVIGQHLSPTVAGCIWATCHASNRNLRMTKRSKIYSRSMRRG